MSQPVATHAVQAYAVVLVHQREDLASSYSLEQTKRITGYPTAQMTTGIDHGAVGWSFHRILYVAWSRVVLDDLVGA
jgi:hypothetical protein